MWVLSVDAGTLLSVVQFDQKKAPAMAKAHGVWDVDGDFLLIRARVKQSLGYLCDVLDALNAGEVEGYTRPIIDEDKTADYHFRTIISRNEWKAYLMYEADGIDYSSHVKEETVARQPEPKIPNLYSALSATWTAWAKLQPNAPYSGLGSHYWQSKPDCKNCDHKEFNHSLKGDSCTGGWDKATNKNRGCSCTNYEGKPVPPKKQTALPSAKGAVGESQPDPAWEGSITVTKPAVRDGEPIEGDALGDADGYHHDWCTFHDGDVCICSPDALTDEELMGEYPSLWFELMAEKDAIEAGPPQEALEPGTYLQAGVVQELPVPGETKQERKARQARNRRARRRASKAARQNV